MTRPTPGDDHGSTAQAEIAHLRRSVLSGRGPGASRAEFLRNTRGRTLVGGRPVSLEREAVARDAAAARGDTDDLLLHVAVAQSRLGDDVEALRSGRVEHPGRPGPLGALARPRVIRLAMLGAAALLAGRSAWRRTLRRLP